MKVVTTTDTSHSITLIPRFDFDTALTFNLYNEQTTDNTDVAITSLEADGFLTITFTYTFVENDKYQVKLTDANGDIVYRGKLISTIQTPQEYQLTKDLFYYE